MHPERAGRPSLAIDTIHRVLPEAEAAIAPANAVHTIERAHT